MILTPEESALVVRADWLYLKHRIMEKAISLLGQVQEAVGQLPQWNHVPGGVPALALGAKIAKGERYKDLPYAILDYPRLFSRDDIFALRTMFWWGHDFTATLHLAGHSLLRHRPALRLAQSRLAASGAQLYLPEDPWQHEMGEGIYQPLEACSAAAWEGALEQDFLKLAKPFALQDWEGVVPAIRAFYEAVLDTMQV
ncbi:hypothetical protein GA0116948_11143 [Chitinophaga costaii]|uniref:Uncharacterized protein n=1 Tax=Chitinophaga costaii TaxID=1335309 RepID=A0A1C4F2C9_9BACT|nr:hypothetical protein [Chitinophaga costaii]PUZ22137.1 hypothetical protein DCM91_15560 [Chitinophaga costaii]SCC49885.1 hypothetical protein GA0116948_11143 [Chitinophaga costaii]